MNYHSMKRSELQALCKEHKIPATSANSVLADKLSELLNVKQDNQKPRARQRTCIKSSIETMNENEYAVTRRQAKKVRFSPEVDYERSGKQQKGKEPVVAETRGRRKSMAKKVDEAAVDNVNTVTDDDVQKPIKVTRSRAHIVGKDNVIPTNEKKQGRRASKDVEKETVAVKEPEGNLGKVTRSKANTVGKGDVQLDKSKQSKGTVKDAKKESEPVKETVVGRARVTRSKAETLTEETKEPDLSPEVKKKSGKQTVKNEVKAEPAKEVKDVPVRATRSRGQTSNNDNVVANPPAEKKRTRRDEIVVTDPPIEKKRTRRDTTVAAVPETQDNADKGTRQSRRKKTTVEENTSVNQNESKVETVVEKKVTRSKAPVAKKAEVQQIDEPLEPAGRRNRRKSVIQPKITEVVLPLEEPVNIPARKQKAQAKGSKKPVVVKKEKVKETEKPESPKVRTRKTVAKKQSKDASEKETKEVASASESQTSRKRRGDPVIEDQTIETEIDPVSSSKKSVKKEKASGLKTPASRTVAKKAKLSEIKPNDSDKHAEKSDIVGTPVSKMANLELDEKVVETEQTPAIDESSRRSTRGARSSKKEPSQSAIKEQYTGAGRLSSRKTPGRSTRSGIKVDEKQASEPAIDDAQMVSPEDAEVKPSSDKEVEDNIISASESVNLPNSEDETPSGTGISAIKRTPSPIPEVEETTIEQTQNDEVHVSSVVVSEAEVEVAVDPEKPVLESVIPEVHESETELTKSGSTSEGLQNGEVVEEPFVSAVKTVVIEESVDISIEQSDIKGKSEEGEASMEPSIVEGVSQFNVDAQIDGDEDEKATEDEVDNIDDIQELSADDDKLQGFGLNENGIEDEQVNVPESLTTQSEPEVEFDAVEAEKEPATVSESLPAPDEPAEEVESDVVPSTGNDVHEIPILGKSDDEDGGVGATKEYETDPMPSSTEADISGGDGEDEGVDNAAMEDQEHVADDDTEPIQYEDMPILPEAPSSSYDQVPDPSQNENVPELPQVSIKSPDREEAELATETDQNPTMEESLPLEIQEEEPAVDGSVTDQLPGDLGAYGSPSTEEQSPVDDTVSDPPTTFKENDGDKQEDWGSYSFGADDFQKPVSANENDDVAGQSTKDDQVSGLQTSSPAVANATDEFFNWTDSTLKALLKTPTTAQASHVKDCQQSAVRFTLPDKDDNTTQNPDSSLKSLFATPATTQVSHAVRDALPDEDDSDTEDNATEDPDSSWTLLKKTPASTQVSHVKEHQQSTVRFVLPDKDETKGNATPKPDSSLKGLFTTPATTLEDRQQSTVRSVLPDKDTTQNPDSSLKGLFTTPATSRVSQGISFGFGHPNEEDKAPQYPDSSLKALLKTPATTRGSHVKGSEQSSVRYAFPSEDDTEGDAPQNPASSLKPLFATPATNRVSHAKERQEDDDATQNPGSSLKALFSIHTTTRVSHAEVREGSAVRFDPPAEDEIQGGSTTQIPDSSLKTLFATTHASHAKTQQESTVRFEDHSTASKYPNSSLKTMFATPATTRISHVKDLEQSASGFTTQNRDSSLKNLFATPATTRVGRENTVGFTLPDDMFDQEGKQEGLAEEPTSGSFGVESYEDAFHKFFDGKTDTGSVGNAEFEETPQKVSQAGNEGAGSSLKTLFKTPGTTRTSHVKESQQSGVSFGFPQGSEIEDPKSQSFEEFASKYFGFKEDQTDSGTSHPKE